MIITRWSWSFSKGLRWALPITAFILMPVFRDATVLIGALLVLALGGLRRVIDVEAVAGDDDSWHGNDDSVKYEQLIQERMANKIKSEHASHE